jgi:hypothetical protein
MYLVKYVGHQQAVDREILVRNNLRLLVDCQLEGRFIMRKIIPLLVLASMICGCATPVTSFVVSVDSLNNGKLISEKRYLISSGMKDVNADDLQFMEYVSYVKRAFASQGLTVVEDPKDAEIAVFLTYGIGEPKEHAYTYSVPIWGQTGVSSARTFGQVSSFGNFGTYSSHTTYTPTYGIVGSNTRQGTFITYFRYLVIDAYDLDAYRKSQKEVQVWKTTIASVGSSGDLRRVFPALVAASSPYFGKNTGQKIIVELREDDPKMMEVKGITVEKKDDKKKK